MTNIDTTSNSETETESQRIKVAVPRREDVPEMFGTYEVAQCLGKLPSNIKRTRGLPEPVQKIRASKLWLADEIREFALEVEARREKRHSHGA